ncbi:MAG: hypothetical protein Q4Q53_07685 [Methanocorpusculum sp.]|nr:hypothetical protein [Methanocorpusculum sp.]
MYQKTADTKNNSKTIRIMESLLLAVIITAAVTSAGCIHNEAETLDIETVAVDIPQDLHEGIHEIYKNQNILETSVASDIHILSEKIGDAETADEKNKIILEYYSNNPWIGCIIFYDAVKDEYTTFPLISLSQTIMDAIPYPTESELRAAPDGVITESSIFIPEHGYLNVYCKGVFDYQNKYLGYYLVFSDLYIQMNLHPQIIDSVKNYGDKIVFITDSSGKIIYSSTLETIGEYVTKDEPFFDGRVLLKAPENDSGAYKYNSTAFYANMRNLETEKITAWHVIKKGDYKYTIYAVKELNRPELIRENAFTLNTKNTLNDIIDLYAYSKRNGVDKAIDNINSGAYSTNIYVMDMNGEVAASKNNAIIGLSYLNNRGAYGYSYTAAMIDTVKQGGGYVYYTFPIDGTVNTPAAEYTISYVLPLTENYFVMGGFPGDTDLVMKDYNVRSDLTMVTREVVKEIYYDGLNSVVDKINNNREKGGSIFVEGLKTDVKDVSIVDMEGNVLASMYYASSVGDSATGFKDVYGGSTTRKSILLAKNGGGFIVNLVSNPDREGYVDLWAAAVEPIDKNYYSYVGCVLKTFKDELTPYINR